MAMDGMSIHLPEVAAPDPDVPDTDDSGDSPSEDTAPDVLEPTPSGWSAIPLGVGDISAVRWLPTLGFRLVGQDGAIGRQLGATWVREYSPWTTLTLRDIAEAGGRAVAVGDSGLWLDSGPDGVWTPRTLATDQDLNGATALGAALLAVGAGGTVVRMDDFGVSYELTSDAAVFRAVAAGDSVAFAVGDDGAVWRRLATPDGDAPFDWVADSGATTEEHLYGALALSDTSAWAVGAGGEILRFNGSWSTEPTNASETLRAVTGAAGRVVAVGSQGTFLERAADTSWWPVPDLQGPLLAGHDYSGVAVAGGQIVAGGAGGALQIKQLPDGPYLDQEARPNATIRDVAEAGGIAVLAGDHGLLVRVDSGGYGALRVDTTANLLAAHVTADGEAWAVGDGGTVVWHRPGKAVKTLQITPAVSLHGMTAVAGFVTAVGAAGVAVRIDTWTKSWSVEQTGQSADLLDLFASGGDTLTAVGRSGRVMIRKDKQWTELDAGLSVDLHAGAFGGGRSVVVGDKGTVAWWEPGGEVHTRQLSPTAVYYDVAVNADGDADLVGWAGAVHQLLGSELTQVETPTSAALYAVMRSQGTLWIGGSGGELWRYVD